MIQSSNPQKLVEWKISIEKIVPLFAGGAAFAIIRTAYFQYYAEFGLTPESVGIGAARILSDLLIGPVLIGVLLAALCLLAYVGQLRLRRVENSTWRFTGRNMLRVTVMAATLGMLASTAYLVLLSRSAATDATTKGVQFSSVSFNLGVLRIPLLQISARHVESLASNGPTEQPIIDIKYDSCLIFVGESDGRTYFYQTQKQELYTLSTNSINYSLDATGRPLAATCEPRGGLMRQSR